jgi:hypothetical protein
VPAARDKNDNRSGIQAAINPMHFDRWIVNVDDAIDAAQSGDAHVVPFRLTYPIQHENW